MKIFIPFIAVFAIVLIALAAKPLPTYSKNDLIGNFEPEQHPEFTRVADGYTSQGTYLRKETYAAFVRMVKAAQKDGINLIIVSGTRNRNRQIEIWTEKWNRFEGDTLDKIAEILTYSSMPGTSRHHWGTDFDLNSVEAAHFESGAGEKTYAWLQSNALKFGFFQPYILKGTERKKGYHEEKWHWSYYPIANQMLQAYKRMITYNDIVGFPGADKASAMHVISHFVEGLPDLNEQHNGFLNLATAN